MNQSPLTSITTRRAHQLARTNPRYARAFFGARRRFDLTTPEVVLADVICVLSRKTGWCFASREYLASLLGVSERSLRRMLARLKAQKLIESDLKRPRQLRVTLLWITENQADDVAAQ